MTALPESKTLLTELDNGWLTIWFNTPENRNALSEALIDDLRATLDAIREDRSVRGVTLRGKGGVFCAGGDLKGFKSAFHGDSASHQDVAAMNRAGGEFFATLNALPQVTVAFIEGAAIAGGLGLACCCDLVLVEENAKFSLTETQIGIPPAQIAPYVVKRIGLAAARRIMLTGARFAGEDAMKFGLANFIGSDAAALEAIEADIKRDVLRCAPGANAATKAILLSSDHLEASELQAFAADQFADCMLSEEGREGIASFIEKRKPKWATQG